MTVRVLIQTQGRWFIGAVFPSGEGPRRLAACHTLVFRRKKEAFQMNFSWEKTVLPSQEMQQTDSFGLRCPQRCRAFQDLWLQVVQGVRCLLPDSPSFSCLSASEVCHPHTAHPLAPLVLMCSEWGDCRVSPGQLLEARRPDTRQMSSLGFAWHWKLAFLITSFKFSILTSNFPLHLVCSTGKKASKSYFHVKTRVWPH